MESFFCLDCNSVGPLDIHGRCGSCHSDSVVSNEANYARQEVAKDVAELERMFKG